MGGMNNSKHKQTGGAFPPERGLTPNGGGEAHTDKGGTVLKRIIGADVGMVVGMVIKG
jgi:hypothetical protein